MNGWIGRDLEDLALFVQVVEQGSFTAASRLTAIPQSTISRRVAGLEARMGALLLDRTTRRLHLTEVGRRTFGHARLMLAEAEAARDEVDVLRGTPRGLLRVAAPVLLGRSRLPSVITRYMKTHAEVAVALEWTTRRLDPVEDIVDVVIDIEPPRNSGAWCDVLFASRQGVYVSPAFRGAVPQHPRELADRPLFGVTRGPPAQTLTFLRDGEQAPVPAFFRLRTNEIGAVIDAADACRGYALLPDFSAPAGWRQACPDWALPATQIVALTTRQGRRLPRVATFIEMLTSDFGQQAG